MSVTTPPRRSASQEPKFGTLDAPGAPDDVKAVWDATPYHDRVSTAFLAPKISEAQFQAQVIRYARMMGWTVWHDHDSRRNAAGLPDLILVRRPRLVWAELKSARGRVTPDQRAWIEELRACGQDARIWRPDDWPEIERVLR